MSKKKTVYDGITAWMSAKADNKEKRFIQVGNSLLLSKEFQKLGVGARCLYMCMAMESAGKRGFEFPLSAAKSHPCTGRIKNKLHILFKGNVQL